MDNGGPHVVQHMLHLEHSRFQLQQAMVAMLLAGTFGALASSFLTYMGVPWWSHLILIAYLLLACFIVVVKAIHTRQRRDMWLARMEAEAQAGDDILSGRKVH